MTTGPYLPAAWKLDLVVSQGCQLLVSRNTQLSGFLPALLQGLGSLAGNGLGRTLSASPLVVSDSVQPRGL